VRASWLPVGGGAGWAVRGARGGGGCAARCAVAFGEISMCNHSPIPNARFEVDAGAQTVTLTALTDIASDAEILIDYQDFAEEAL
jgi:hypothetical protein